MKTISIIMFHAKVGIIFLLLIACGDPVQLTMDRAFEEQLDSVVQKPETIRAPKYRKPNTPLVRRPISDIVEKDTISTTPPPAQASPTPPPPPAQASAPVYVQTLAENTTGPSDAKIRRTGGASFTFTIAPVMGNGKVDIIVIMDVSHSMGPFLTTRAINKKFNGFISALEPLDWQMMFTNADYGDRWFLANLGARDGKAMRLEYNGKTLNSKVLTKQTPQYHSVFMDTLRHHEEGEYTRNRDQNVDQCHLAPGCQSMTFNEQPLKALKASFVNNRSLFRPGADVVAIIFSDSDEGERHKDGSKRTKADDVLEAFQKQWGIDDKRLVAYSIIMIPGEDNQCVEKYSSGFYPGEGLFGTELARMAELTNGTNYSLCDESYVPLAQKMVADFQAQ